MENQIKLVSKKICVLAWLNKDGYECRALCIDLGYSTKMLCFKAQDIAEVLGMSVVDFVAKTPIIEGQRTKYMVEV